MGVDAVVGHSSASLGPGDKAVKKGKAKTSKRKAATQKTATSGNCVCCNIATATIVVLCFKFAMHMVSAEKRATLS